MTAVDHGSDKAVRNSLVRTAHLEPRIEQAGGVLVHEPELVDFAVAASILKAREGDFVAATQRRQYLQLLRLATSILSDCSFLDLRLVRCGVGSPAGGCW
jgi:hypothetical protein